MNLSSDQPTIAECLKSASLRLREQGIANDVLDAQLLLAEALGCDRTYLVVNFNLSPDATRLKYFDTLVSRRATGEPLQYILGRQEFYGLEFEVNPAVLIPRPETELLVEEAVRLASSISRPLIIDVGTGSGCIAVAVAREVPDATIMAVDISPAALEVAARNAARHGLSDRINFKLSNLLDGLGPGTTADLILSNPPYIDPSEIPSLQREVRDWEPRIALTDENDGLSNYRRLLQGAGAFLKTEGKLIVEVGYEQAGKVAALATEFGWSETRVLQDLAGIDRTLVISK